MVWVEVPPEWGPKQRISVALRALGYQVEERRQIATGEVRLALK